MDVRGVAIPLGAALLAGVLAGCGSGDDTISSSTADDLHRQVDAVRAAVADGRDPAALAAVTDLKATIRRLAGSGDLNPADGLVLLTQVDRIATRIENRATPTPAPTPTPTPEPAADKPKGKDDKPKGKGKGHE
jgi:hypothetical protein